MALLETFAAEPPPLRQDESGAIRVGSTRVTLDTVVLAWKEGATAEEIVYGYDTLNLADVHAVLSYYLRHAEQVETYLNQRREEAEELRRKIEKRFPPQEFRELLLSRQRVREQD
jgi:uncharacterized protein (DUF433 family)